MSDVTDTMLVSCGSRTGRIDDREVQGLCPHVGTGRVRRLDDIDSLDSIILAFGNSRLGLGYNNFLDVDGRDGVSLCHFFHVGRPRVSERLSQ